MIQEHSKSKRKSFAFENIPHGTHNGYNNFGCRCELCTQANTQYAKDVRLKKSKEACPENMHGTSTGIHIYHCKCEKCKSYRAQKHLRWSGLLKGNTLSDKAHGKIMTFTYGCRCDICVQKQIEREERKRKDIERERKYGKNKNSRYKNDTQRRIAKNLRARLTMAVKSKSKYGSAVRDLGCSIEEFILYLEDQFRDGMSWENYGNRKGQWNIDHIIPLNTFNLEDRDQFSIACHYTNLRPMWASENTSRPHNGMDVVDKEEYLKIDKIRNDFTAEVKPSRKIPLCHPDRKVAGRGMCRECYNKWYNEGGAEEIKLSSAVKCRAE